MCLEIFLSVIFFKNICFAQKESYAQTPQWPLEKTPLELFQNNINIIAPQQYTLGTILLEKQKDFDFLKPFQLTKA